MRPGVCTAPEPALERGCPSEGCQLAVLELRLNPNYVEQKRQAASSSTGVEQVRITLSLDACARRRRSTPLLDVLLAVGSLPPPPHPTQRALPRPDFVQGLALVEPAVLHHVADRVGIVDVLERVGVEHDEIGELARLERTQVVLHAEGVRAVAGADLQYLVRRHPARRHRPELPMAAQAVELAVAPQPD